MSGDLAVAAGAHVRDGLSGHTGANADAGAHAPAAAAERAALATLARATASLGAVMAALTVLDASATAYRPLALGIAANVTVDLLATALRRHAYLAGVRLQVRKGSYDDLHGDAQAHAAAGVDLLLVLPFFDNLQPAWEARLGQLDSAGRDAVHADVLERLALALDAARGIGSVIVFGAHAWQAQGAGDGVIAQALDDFNATLAARVARHANARLLSTAGLLAQCGRAAAFDARFYYRAKAPYTPLFVDRLAREVALATRGFGQRFHKVLVLDCDNTLWGGIVGEDGPAGIRLDPHAHPGNVFWAVQQQLRSLEAQGVLLCLCSKNNAQDVDEVLAHHPAMVLRETHLAAHRVNWQDKPANLRALARELNLGLESFVFVDDSAFEVEAVREQLPQVTVFQVPPVLADYPALVSEAIAPLFLAAGVSAESRGKTQQYRSLADAAREQATFENHEAYLRSLGLVVTLQRDARAQVARIAELVNKSNQFNLTTERLQAGDVLALMARTDATVYSFAVRDRLADHGLTGVLITVDGADERDDTVRVHSFLMSCRVIGRGVEFAVWRAVARDALARGKRLLEAAYRPTAKNAQVADFYPRLGLVAAGEAGDGSRLFETGLALLNADVSPWVELQDA